MRIRQLRGGLFRGVPPRTQCGIFSVGLPRLADVKNQPVASIERPAGRASQKASKEIHMTAKTAQEYAQEVIEAGRIDAKSAKTRAEQIEAEVEFQARDDGRKDSAELAANAKKWYRR